MPPTDATPAAETLLAVWRQFRRTRDPHLRNTLLLASRSLITRAASRLARELPPWIDRAELEAAGVPGLLAAIETYDPDRNVRFTTYAYYHVRGAMLDSLRALDPLARSLRRTWRDIQQTTHTPQQHLLRSPDDSEIATALGLSLAEYHHIRVRLAAGLERSLDTPPVDHPDHDRTFRPTLPQSHMLDPYDKMARDETCTILSSLINRLPDMARQVLTLHYRDQLTFKDIAQALHLSETRISQLHASAIEHLRGHLRRRHIPIEDLRIDSPHPRPPVLVSLRP